MNKSYPLCYHELMSAVQKRTFSLPLEQSKFIDEQVKAGKFASGSKVIRAGLRALQARDEVMEKWLNEEVATAYDAIKAGESKIISVGDAFDQLRAKHAARAKND